MSTDHYRLGRRMDLKPAVQYLRASQHQNTAGTFEEMRRLLHGELGGVTLKGVALFASEAVAVLAEMTGEPVEQIIDQLEMKIASAIR